MNLFAWREFLKHSLITIGLLLTLVPTSFESEASAQRVTANPVAAQSGESRRMRILTLRLRPGQDLRQELEVFVKEKKIRAGFIITGVGSLRKAAIRLADQSGAAVFDQKFEIVSLVGTLGQDGVHLHISISDKEGRTLGGHLVAGRLIYTTAEIVIGDAQGLWFSREQDSETGYKELRIHRVLNRRRSL